MIKSGLCFLLAISATTLATPAAAAPVYLICSFTEDAAGDLQVTVDEVNASASVYLASNGYSQQFKAAFGPDTVAFESSQHEYALSRTGLTLRRTIKMLRGYPSAVDIGQCRLQAVPKRAF